MKRLRLLAVLMGITIVVITGFQVYWLKENYAREERALEMKSNMAFRETINKLQASKLNVSNITPDTAAGKLRVMFDEHMASPVRVRVAPKQDVLTMINVLRDKVRDSIKTDTGKAMVIAVDRSAMFYRDTMRIKTKSNFNGNERIFQFLYRVDSLQDSLKVPEITSAYTKTLRHENLNIPFTINRLDSTAETGVPNFNEVTVGFAKPITYRLQLGNTFPYVVKRLSTPILFSLFLVGVTILSFVLLYRNLWQQKKLADIKNEFISNITHELKTPIATVGVAIEAMKNFNAMQDPERTKEYLDISANELQRLSLLVDKVLKLSMFEKKEVDLKYERLNLKDVVDEVVSSMRLQFEKNNASVSVTHAGDLTMEGDRLHLLSVVFNLLDNAVKYRNGTPAIQIDLKEEGNNIQLNVADNGIGIDPEYREKIFEKFFRIPTGNTHNAKGYGLGLSYSAHVIKQHNGKISVDSKPGLGSSFIVILPKNLNH